MRISTRWLTLLVTGIVILTTLSAGGTAKPLVHDSPSELGPTTTINSVGPPNATNGTATFEITNFSAPANATTKQPVTVTATLNNTGNASGTQLIEYRFNGSVVDSRPVTLMATQNRTVQFTLQTRGLDAGQYTHGVQSADDSVTATLNISGSDGDGPVGNLSGDVASFPETSPLTPPQVTPHNLSGKLRVESSVASNTSVTLVRNSSTDYSLSINVTGHATNVTFYLQKQALAASQNISNVTAYLDGDEFNFTVRQSHGQWVVFVVDHFSTRNVTFGSTADITARNIDQDLPLEDVDGSGTFNIVDVQALFVELQNTP